MGTHETVLSNVQVSAGRLEKLQSIELPVRSTITNKKKGVEPFHPPFQTTQNDQLSKFFTAFSISVKRLESMFVRQITADLFSASSFISAV